MDKLANIASQLTEKRTLPEFKAGDTVRKEFSNTRVLLFNARALE
jgi:ribosomal protein L19